MNTKALRAIGALETHRVPRLTEDGLQIYRTETTGDVTPYVQTFEADGVTPIVDKNGHNVLSGGEPVTKEVPVMDTAFVMTTGEVLAALAAPAVFKKTSLTKYFLALSATATAMGKEVPYFGTIWELPNGSDWIKRFEGTLSGGNYIGGQAVLQQAPQFLRADIGLLQAALYGMQQSRYEQITGERWNPATTEADIEAARAG